MTAVAPTDSRLPQETSPSIPGIIAGTLISNGIGMAANYAITYSLYSPFHYFGYCETATRTNFSALAALSVPVRPITSYCFKTLLECDENTPYRNMTENIATMLYTSAIAAAACNYLGYNINITNLLYNNLQVAAFTVVNAGMILGIEYLLPIDEEMENEDAELSEEEPQMIDPDRFKPFNLTPAAKTERAAQLVLNEI